MASALQTLLQMGIAPKAVSAPGTNYIGADRNDAIPVFQDKTVDNGQQYDPSSDSWAPGGQGTMSGAQQALGELIRRNNIPGNDGMGYKTALELFTKDPNWVAQWNQQYPGTLPMVGESLNAYGRQWANKGGGGAFTDAIPLILAIAGGAMFSGAGIAGEAAIPASAAGVGVEGGTAALASTAGAGAGGAAATASPIASWGNAVGDEALGQQFVQNANAAGMNLGNAAQGTGMWSGSTFGPNGMIPYGAPGDLTPLPGGPAAAPSGVQLPQTPTMTPTSGAPGATPLATPAAGAGAANAGTGSGAASAAAPAPGMFDSIGSTVSTALGVGSLVNAGTNLIGAGMQADAAKDAATIQAQATQAGINEQARQYDTTRADLAPYRAAGTTALTNLGAGVGADGTSGPLTRKFSINDFWQDPVVQAGYQSGLDLGTKALRNAAPLTTGIDSGAAMKELTKFGTDYTGGMAAGSQARFVGDQTNVFNRNAALAGVGQTATNTGVQAGTNAANNTSAMLTAQGNAGAAARIGGANAWGGALNNISNWWSSQDMLNRYQSIADSIRKGVNGGTSSIANWMSLPAESFAG